MSERIEPDITLTITSKEKYRSALAQIFTPMKMVVIGNLTLQVVSIDVQNEELHVGLK